ncbi:MAG: hypothetical protein ACTS4U_01210 [Candidatus Hodgkinia cicadicola]
MNYNGMRDWWTLDVSQQGSSRTLGLSKREPIVLRYDVSAARNENLWTELTWKRPCEGRLMRSCCGVLNQSARLEVNALLEVIIGFALCGTAGDTANFALFSSYAV